MGQVRIYKAMGAVPRWRWLEVALLAAVCLAVAGCRWIVTPKGEPAEREKAARAEGVFALPIEKRPLPDLATSPTLPKVLEYAFNANGEIEGAYREWRAAIERVPQAGALPDPRLEFSSMFNTGNVKSFSDVLQSVKAAYSQELSNPAKREARAELALAEAEAAGERFRAAKYRLQRQVVAAYAQLALNESLEELTSHTLRLFRETYEVALHRFHAMNEESLTGLRKVEIEIQRAESDQRALRIARQGLAAELNGALNRPTTSPLGITALPEVVSPSMTEAGLFARAVASNADLAALRKEIEARGAAQTLADLEKRPDYSVGGSLEFQGGAPSPGLDFGMTLPLNRARIHAGIEEALAARQAAEARYRAARSDTLARLVLSLSTIRDARRIIADYRDRIVPLTDQLLQTQLTTYGSGSGEFLDILDTERLLVDFRRLLLQAEADRLRFLSELEEIIGEDLFGWVGESR